MALTFLRWHRYLALYFSENWPLTRKKNVQNETLDFVLVIILYSAFSSSVNISKIHAGAKAILWKSAFYLLSHISTISANPINSMYKMVLKDKHFYPFFILHSTPGQFLFLPLH